VTFVVNDDALGADVKLVVFAEELRPLVWVLQAILLRRQLFLLMFVLFLLRCHVPLAVQVVKYSEILDQLLHIGAEVAATGGARQDIARAQVHQTVLAESVPTG